MLVFSKYFGWMSANGFTLKSELKLGVIHSLHWN